MKAANLKLELIKKIIDIGDINLLLKIDALLNDKNQTELPGNISEANEPALKYENVRVFSAEEQQKINRALKQVENGEVISDEEAQIELEKWFEEQEKQFGQ